MCHNSHDNYFVNLGKNCHIISTTLLRKNHEANAGVSKLSYKLYFKILFRKCGEEMEGLEKYNPQI